MTQDNRETPILEARQLTMHYTTHVGIAGRLQGQTGHVLKAVQDVDLAISTGETVGIVGESGCGKSTLARALVGLETLTDGKLFFRGRDVAERSSAVRQNYRRSVQMIFQDPAGSLNPMLTAGSAIGEVLDVHRRNGGDRAARVQELLALVNLPPESAGRRPHQFSGGQRQRIGIARALAVEPEVLIADEAVSALDVSVQGQIINLLMDLQTRLGLAIVFISHDLRLVRHIAHRVLVMYLGRVVEAGPAAEVFAAPRHPYTWALREAVPGLRPARSRRAPALDGELPSPIAPPSGCPFHPRCPIARPVCATDRPQLIARGGAWRAACHFPDEIRSAGNTR